MNSCARNYPRRTTAAVSSMALAVAIAGCQTITPAQQAAIFCVVAADGSAIAVAATKGGAQATAQRAQGASVVACSAATQVGQIISAQK